MALKRINWGRALLYLLATVVGGVFVCHENVFEDIGPSSSIAVRITVVCVVLAVLFGLAYWIPERILEKRLLIQMTGHAAIGKKFESDEALPWDDPITHLRYNARRMRYSASLVLVIIFVTILIALLFYTFASTLGPTINVHAGTSAVVTLSTSQVDWPTLAARVVIGGLLIFLVQTLAGIYRYSIRMAAFYEGRAAALMMFSTPEQQAPLDRDYRKDLVDWLAGDKVEFEKAPKSPTENLSDATKTALLSTKAAFKR